MKPGTNDVDHPFARELRAVLDRRGDELARRGRRYLASVGYRTEDSQRRAARRLLGLDPQADPVSVERGAGDPSPRQHRPRR